MSERTIIGMIALATLCAVFVLVPAPASATFSALMFFLLGFEAVVNAIKARANPPQSEKGLEP